MNSDYHKALEWDVLTWSRALAFWEQCIQNQNIVLTTGLEIGARHGGLSGYFAKHFESQMICTDYDLPAERRFPFEDEIASKLHFQTADVTQLPFPEASFDFVIFKSVLGAVGRNGHPERQQQALREIHRVLKPGGVMFFAENLRASALHHWSRRIFKPWGKSWRYVTLTEMSHWLAIFEKTKLKSTGFLASFVPNINWIKGLATQFDRLLEFLPSNWKYVGYGIARK